MPIGKWRTGDLQFTAQGDFGPIQKVNNVDGRHDPVQVTGTAGTIGNDCFSVGFLAAKGCPGLGEAGIDGGDSTSFSATQRMLATMFHFYQAVAHISQYLANRLLRRQIVA